MKRSELLLRMTFCVLMLIGVLALPFRIHADNVEDTASLRINSNEFEFNLRKHILIVNSYHQGYSWTDGITTGILDVFYRHGLNAEIHIENLDSKRIRNPKVWKTALTNNIESFPPDYLDLIIVSDDDALNTLFEMGHAYHSVPIVFCGISSDVAAIPQKCPVFTGVEEYLPFEENIRLGLKLFPGTEHIVVVTDNSQTGQTHRQEAEQTLKKLALNDMDVIWLDGTSGLSTADLADRLRTLPDNSIVIFSIWHIDGEGHYWDPGNYYPLFSKICNAPVFVNTDVGLKYGFLGGKMSLSGKQGELAGELAVQILFGELQDKTYYIKDINEYRFNWQELKRWGIRRKDLPAGSLILNRPLTIYNQYKTFFWVTLSLIIMLFLLIWVVLIYHYRYRRYETQRTLQAHETKRLANRYNILLEQSNSAILIFRIESGEVLDVNRKACELFEYSEEKFLKLNLNRYFHNYHELMSEIDILKASPHEMELLKHDSGVFYAQVILNYLEEEDEKLIYAIVNDISIRKQQEEEIKKSRARLDEVLLYSKNAFWEWNLRTGKLRKDANFWRALDVDPATLKRDPEEAEYYLDHVHPEDREAFVL
ncbi:MAG: PAS domain S-box protein, partial [Candidatus Marinimicrobia bacterium]|nr:PAS domain S-box protein [Candidatus Neomarinimicrobiota bacterium]